MSLETIGWIGSIAFAFCTLPQAFLSYKQGHSKGISNGLLILWSIGEFCTLAYVLPKHDWPLIFNYCCNLLFMSIIVYFKVRPRK